jgi:mannose-6-phosphate isomerase-like protein (cupin superfamily)
MSYTCKQASSIPDAIAPDGSEVRVLCEVGRGGLALFTLPPKAVSKAVAHRSVEEVWCFITGAGHMWLRCDEREDVFEVRPGTSVSIPVGTHFQFRSDSHEPLTAVGATMPPWPSEGDAYVVNGIWQPTV